MQFDLPTQKLSPKHQVTLPKGARALAAAEGDGYVCGLLHRLQRPATGEWYPAVVLMSEDQLDAMEEQLRAISGTDVVTAEANIARLRGTVQRLAIDGQRRVVLPKHFVSYLRLEREVYMYSTSKTVLAWNPVDFSNWLGTEDTAAGVEPLPLTMI